MLLERRKGRDREQHYLVKQSSPVFLKADKAEIHLFVACVWRPVHLGAFIFTQKQCLKSSSNWPRPQAHRGSQVHPSLPEQETGINAQRSSSWGWNRAVGRKTSPKPNICLWENGNAGFQCCVGETVPSLLMKSLFYMCAEKPSRSPPGVSVAVAW